MRAKSSSEPRSEGLGGDLLSGPHKPKTMSRREMLREQVNQP